MAMLTFTLVAFHDFIRCPHHRAAHDASQPPQLPRGRGRGGGGSGGRGRGNRGGPAVPRIRRAAADRVASKLRVELRLQAAAANNPDDCETFDADADFHEDVLDAAVSDDEDANPGLFNPGPIDEFPPSPGESEHEADGELPFDSEPLSPAPAVMTPNAHSCMRRWHITMPTTLRALTDIAGNPTTEQPRCLSLVQRNNLVDWFAWEPELVPPQLDGRITTLDDRCRVQYVHPGPLRKNVVDLTPEIHSGASRILLHTDTIHARCRPADAAEMSISNLVVKRCWSMLAEPAYTVCTGCRAESRVCALCLSAMALCCLSTESIGSFDAMSSLLEAHHVGLTSESIWCHTLPPAAQSLIWEIRSRRDDVLCQLCNDWLYRRDKD